MDNTAMALMALTGLLVILFFAALVLGFKTWRLPHLMVALAVFLAGVTYVGLATATLDVHRSWGEFVNQYRADVEARQQEAIELEKGPPRPPDADPDAVLQAGVLQLDQQLKHLLEDRGRVWHGEGTMTAENGQVRVHTPEQHEIAVGMVLFAFEEGEAGIYLGMFRVAAVANDVVTIERTISRGAEETERIAGRRGEWTLYDIMPVDSHEIFEGMSREELADLLPQDRGLFFDDQGPARLVDDYFRSGTPATDEDERNHPDRVWVRVEMTVTDPDRTFPAMMPDGETAEISLRRGNRMLVDQRTAAELVEADEAREIERLYFRPLVRYEGLFLAHYEESVRLRDLIAQKKIQQRKVAESQAIAETRVASRQQEKSRLEADLEKVQFELEVLEKQVAALDRKEADLRQAVSAAYRENNRLAAELAAMQLEINRRFTQRTAAASAD